MDDVVLINFKNIYNGTFNTINVKRDDDIRTIKLRWNGITKCNSCSFSFKTEDGSRLPDEGKISDVLKGNQFSVGVIVETLNSTANHSSRNVDIVVSYDINEVQIEDLFITVERNETGVSVRHMRGVIENKLGKGVELYQNVWKSENGTKLDETVDGLVNSFGAKCCLVCGPKEERVLQDADDIPIVHNEHSPVIKWRPKEAETSVTDCPGLHSGAKATARRSTETATFSISYLHKREKRSFRITVDKLYSRVPVVDIRSAVEKELGFCVSLRQKRIVNSRGDDAVLTEKGYVSESGVVDPVHGNQNMKNILLSDSDPPLIVPKGVFAVIRASKA